MTPPSPLCKCHCPRQGMRDTQHWTFSGLHWKMGPPGDTSNPQQAFWEQGKPYHLSSGSKQIQERRGRCLVPRVGGWGGCKLTTTGSGCSVNQVGQGNSGQSEHDKVTRMWCHRDPWPYASFWLEANLLSFESRVTSL